MDPYVMAFDHAQNRWSEAIQAGQNPIDERDTHGNPALWVDREGRVHLLYGCHGGPAKHVRSAGPEDIYSWETLYDMGKNREAYWADYLAKREAAGHSRREPGN